MYRLILTEYQFDRLCSHAAETPDTEVCGLVGGAWQGMTAVAQQIVAVPNIAAQPTAHFVMAPQVQVRVMLDFEDAGLALVAIYHSHPRGPSVPSETDIREYAYPDSLCVILSPDEHKVFGATAWRIRQGKVYPAKVNTHPQ